MLGRFYDSRAYLGADLEPETRWYVCDAVDRVRDMPEEEQLSEGYLLRVKRAMPCTLWGSNASVEKGTKFYLVRWRDTNDLMEFGQKPNDPYAVQVMVSPMQITKDWQTVDCYADCHVPIEDYFETVHH